MFMYTVGSGGGEAGGAAGYRWAREGRYRRVGKAGLRKTVSR